MGEGSGFCGVVQVFVLFFCVSRARGRGLCSVFSVQGHMCCLCNYITLYYGNSYIIK